MPQRPGSRPQSPAPSITSPTPTFASLAQALPPNLATPIDFDLVVLDVPRAPVQRDTPFTLRLAITLASHAPAAPRARHVLAAVQHVQPARPPATHTAVSAALASHMHVPSRMSTPSPAPSIAGTETLVESPLLGAFRPAGAALPPPHALEDAGHAPPADGVLFLGPSAQTLPAFVFSRPAEEALQDDDPATPLAPLAPARQEHTREFELSFIATRPGFATVGGLRLVLLSDEEHVESDPTASPPAPHRHETRILKEWNVVSEILVR